MFSSDHYFIVLLFIKGICALYVKLPLGHSATHSKHFEQLKFSAGLVNLGLYKLNFCFSRVDI